MTGMPRCVGGHAAVIRILLLLFSVYSQRPAIGSLPFSFVLDEVMLLSLGERQ
jgi:hypothetical protein